MRDVGYKTEVIAVLAILAFFRCTSGVLAQEQTTQQLPLPTGKTQTQSEDKRWQLTFDSNWSYFSTKETSPTVPGWAKSTLNYLPIAMQFVAIPNDQLKVELLVRSGYMDLYQASSGGGARRLDGWTDTSVNTTFTYYGFNGFQPFASMAVNLPTGDTGFVTATGDPDVTNIAGFGTGFNVGPTIGVNIPITRDLLTTLSAGYTARGAFQRPGRNVVNPVGPGAGLVEDFKPGDVTSVNASIGYQSGLWSFQASGSYSYEEITKIDGVGFYQTGGKYSLSGALGYAWNENWSSKISSSFSHIGNNRYPLDPFTGLVFVQEFFNTNSDMVNVTIDTTWKMGAFAIGPTASYLYRNHNGYDSNTDFFLPAKSKWTFGGAGQYAATNQISFNARLEHLWMTENEIPGPNAPPPAAPVFKTDGWIASIGGKVVF
jgi:hypothetical protein